MCFSCANWDTCLDKNDKTTSCDMYRNKNAKPQTPTAGPVTTYKAKIDDEVEKTAENPDEVIDMIRWCITNAGLEENQARACLILLDDLVATWSLEGME